MTIRITITNEDSQENAIVAVRTVDKSRQNNTGAGGETLLAGGQSKDFYVYEGNGLVVEEVRNG